MTRTLGILILLLSTASVAHAETDPVVADELFRQGRVHVEKGEWAPACQKFAESQRLDPATGTLLNLADCEEHIGQLASALQHWNEAIDALSATDDRLASARDRREKLSVRVPRLTITSRAAANARITRDGSTLGAASLGVALPVNPGPHVVMVTADGRKPRKYDVTIAERETRSLEVDSGEPETPVQIPKIISPKAESKSPLRTYGWIAVGVGTAGLAAGAVFGAFTLNRKRVVDAHCDAQLCDDEGFNAARGGRTWSTVSTVSFIAGGVFLLTGAALVLGSTDSSRTTVSAMPNGAFVGWTKNF